MNTPQLILVIALAFVAGCGDDGGTASPEQTVEALVENLRSDPQRLTALLQRMPKGADLHSHLTGAVQTESLIDAGIEDNLCVDAGGTATAPPCGSRRVPMSDATTDPDLYQSILGAWSMEGFVGDVLERHAHFFATFGKFGAAAGHTADMLIELKRQAVAQHITYLELMSGLGSSQASAVGTDNLPVGDTWTADYLLAHREPMLADPRFARVLGMGESFLAAAFDEVDERLGCGTSSPDPACAIEVRLQVTGARTLPRAAVFAQFLYGFELAQIDDRVVAVNLVAPEEEPNSLAFYDDDMLGVGTLRQLYAAGGGLRLVRVSLHAGELIAAVLPDTPAGQQHLTFHIRHAVEIGHADRIGHGVDLAHEREGDQTPETLLAAMRARGVMVEINLTSNDVLLGIAGSAHPLDAYLGHAVPVALSTDDEGVLRTDLTQQYVRAVVVQDLDYFTLKRLSRNGLEYCFAPGASLWSDAGGYHRLVPDCAGEQPGSDRPSAQCTRYLDANRRAALQWSLERDLTAFEASVGS